MAKQFSIGKQFMIWDSYIDLNDEEWQEAIEDDKCIDPEFWENADEELEMEWCENENYMELEMLRDMLDVDLDRPILVIADLGLWDGRKSAYRLIESGSLREILQSNFHPSEVYWYCDGYDIRGAELHHDGINHYLYRAIRDPENIERFLDMIYFQQGYSLDTLDKYTLSIAKDVEKALGGMI